MDYDKRTALHLASSDGRAEVRRHRTNHVPHNPTLLQSAETFFSLSFPQLFFASVYIILICADICFGNTLFGVCLFVCSQVVNFLLAQGANPHVQDRWGNSPLDDASRGQYTEIAENLSAAMAETAE